MHCTVAFLWIWRKCKVHLPLTKIQKWYNLCLHHPYWAEIQWSYTVWRREERRGNRWKEHPIDNFPPVLSSETLWTNFLWSRASDLNCFLSPLRSSYRDLPSGTALIAHVCWLRSLLDFVRVVELSIIPWHPWGLPLQVSVIAINSIY